MRKIASGLALAFVLGSASAAGSVGTSQVGQTRLVDLDDCQVAYLVRCVSTGGDWSMCEAAAASYVCPAG